MRVGRPGICAKYFQRDPLQNPHQAFSFPRFLIFKIFLPVGKGSMALNLIMPFSNSHAYCWEGIDGVESDNAEQSPHTSCREGTDGVESDNVG